MKRIFIFLRILTFILFVVNTSYSYGSEASISTLKEKSITINTQSSLDSPEINTHKASVTFRLHIFVFLILSLVICGLVGFMIYRKYHNGLLKSRTAIREYTRVASHYKMLSEELTEKMEELQLKLNQADMKAENAEKLKAAFLANMSHEIRTPLTAILGFTDLMHRSFNSEQKRKFYMGMISKNSKALLNLIDDILDISKIEIGEFRFDKTFFRIEPLLEELYVALLQEKKNKDKRDVNIFMNLDSSTSTPEIFADPVRIQQVLWKLLDNALKFIQSGFISFGYDIINQYMRLYIKDTGIGIDLENQAQIFERFRQIDESARRNHGGTGLGLYFCKRMVELMGGKIWVDSYPGKGSTFFVAIPIQKKDEDSQEMEINAEELESLYAYKNIVIAEDNESQFQYLKEILSSTHAVIHWAKNGKEVMDYVDQLNNIDLIIMDIRMPYMDGIETTRKIRENNIEIPILVQTAYASADNELTYLQMGCDDYIAKPIDKKKFLEKISRFIS